LEESHTKSQSGDEDPELYDSGVAALGHMRNIVASGLNSAALQEKLFCNEDIQNMRQEFALDLYHQKLDAHSISMSTEASPSTQSPFSSPSPTSPTSRFYSPAHHVLPPISRKNMLSYSMEDGGHDYDSWEADEEDDEVGGNDLNLTTFQTPHNTQKRLVIPAKPFKQWYILLEHYMPTTIIPGPSNPPLPLLDEDIDLGAAIFTSPAIGPVTVIKNQVKQTLEVHPIITFPTEPDQHSITIDLKEVPGPATIQYHGTPENRVSSWLDAVEWEPLYIIACHDPAFWTWLHGPLTTPANTRIDDLRRCFALRTAVHQLAVENEIPKLLQSIRNCFHSRLKVPPHANGTLAEPKIPAPPFVSTVNTLIHPCLIYTFSMWSENLLEEEQRILGQLPISQH